jgi:hypothetical protein
MSGLHALAVALLLAAPAAHAAVMLVLEHRAPNGSVTRQNCAIAYHNTNGLQARMTCDDRIFASSY